MKVWERDDLFWIAGLFEGEGSIYTQNKSGGQTYVQIDIHMTDKDVLEKVVSALEIGRLKGPYQDRKFAHHKPNYHYQITASKDIARFLCAIAPLLGERRRAACLAAAETLKGKKPYNRRNKGNG